MRPSSSPMNSSGTWGQSSIRAVAARNASRVGQDDQPLAQGAVAHLVVVLQEADEGGRSARSLLGDPRGRPSWFGDGSPW